MHEIISNIAELLIIVWLGFDNINLIFKKKLLRANVEE